jgi:hypothetical protein
MKKLYSDGHIEVTKVARWYIYMGPTDF